MGFAITNTEVLFYSFLKMLVAKKVLRKLKNDSKINGVFQRVDHYLYIKLLHVDVVNKGNHPYRSSVTIIFISVSVVRYVQIAQSNDKFMFPKDATMGY